MRIEHLDKNGFVLKLTRQLRELFPNDHRFTKVEKQGDNELIAGVHQPIVEIGPTREFMQQFLLTLVRNHRALRLQVQLGELTPLILASLYK